MASAASLPLRRGTLARRERYFAYALLAPAVVTVFRVTNTSNGAQDFGLLADNIQPPAAIFGRTDAFDKSLNFLALHTRPFGLGNYEAVLTDSATWHSVWVSFAYTFGTIAPAFAIGLGTAVLLNRVFPLRRWLRAS